jgi:hypothetical protein
VAVLGGPVQEVADGGGAGAGEHPGVDVVLGEGGQGGAAFVEPGEEGDGGADLLAGDVGCGAWSRVAGGAAA